jgi:hypothetical protein
MTARQHHYLSQCYLKGFTKGRAKKSKLWVLGPRIRKAFQTTPRNVGGVRDFNRINSPEVDQDALETELAKFESKAASALKQLLQTLSFSGETRDVLLNLMALLAVRSPERREHMRKFHADVVERLMELTLHSKERWESQYKQAKADHPEMSDDVSYEDMKAFFESKRYKVEVSREHHIHMEMVQVDAILPCLYRRNWTLLKANASSGPFITTDKPVDLSWNDPDSVPPIYRSSPGFGLKSTQVYFPLSQDLAVIGEFDGTDRTMNATEAFVALLNSKMLYSFHNQIYTPTMGFKFVGKGNTIRPGSQLVRAFGP